MLYCFLCVGAGAQEGLLYAQIKKVYKMKNWTHFTNRKRYIKNTSGEYTGESFYERAFCALLANESRDWLCKYIKKGELAQCLFVGNTNESINVVFVFDSKNNILFVNNKNNSNANEYVEFFESELKNKKIEFTKKAVELPSVIHKRNSNSTRVDSLEKALSLASNDSLGF